MPEPILTAERVRKVYRSGGSDVVALKGLDLNVAKGEFLAVMGPSGSGKTTLLNCLSGLDEIDEGRVLVEGRSIHELSDAKRTRHRAETMGFIFQAFNLIPVFSATENVELPLLLMRVPENEARERARETLTRVGLGHRLDRRPPELSGGEQQRVAIARALAGRPRIVWADEPTGNLDSEMAASVMDLLCEFHGEGLTLLLITHDPAVGARADRLITVKDGDIVDDTLQVTAPAVPPARDHVMTPALVLVLILSLPFLWVLARRPVLRRLAVRNALRRPREAALVVLGSLLGAAIITGSMVVGDTMNASIRQVARTHLGPIDELVSTRGTIDQQQLLTVYRPLAHEDGDIDGILALSWMDGVVTTTGPRILSAPRAQVLGVDFEAARSFGGDPAATGIAGPTPALGHAAISSDLARALEAAPGARIAVRAFGLRSELIVDRILPRRGIAGFWLGAEQEARNVIVSPTTFDRITSGAASGVPPTWAIAVSNRGGVESGASRTDRVLHALRAASPAPPLDPQIYAAKQTTLDTADTVGKGFSSMFTAMGSFGVLAGLLLLVNLFVMLAAERKAELGMARAVGMRRSELVAVFATEGWLYALTATALGVVTGIGLGRILVAVSARVFSTEHNRFDLFFTVQPRSLALSFAIGFTVALLTIVLTSVHVSRLNIIRAIRDLEEPPRRQGRLLWVGFGCLLVVLGVVATLRGAETTDGFGLLLGPTLVVVGLAPLAARFLPAHTVNTVAALLVVVWGATLFGLVPSSTEGASVMLYVVQGIVLTAAAVVLLSLQQDRVSRALRFVTGGRSLSLRLGLAYPLARRSRTGLTIAMYALVVFILTFITSLAHMIDQQVATATRDVQGGYSVILASSPASPVRPSRLESLDGVMTVAPLSRSLAFFRAGSMRSDAPWNMTAFDQRFVEGGPPRLEDRGSYRTDADAWEAVLHDDSLVIVEPTFLQTTGGPSGFIVKPGSKLVARDPRTGRTRVLTVAALSPSDYFIQNGAFYGADGARTLFGYEPTFDRLVIALRPDVDPDAFAADAQAAFVANGAEAVSIGTIMDEGFTMTRQIFQLFEGYLAMGLIVGIAGTAVVMIRAVRERRRQIGTLRALGFGARPVGRSFAIESAFIAIEGTVIGALLALVTLYDIVSLSDSFGQLAFSVPYVQLGILLAATVGASLLATVWPAVSASRIRPAVALRTTD